jgi:hypothetical protein
MTRGRRGEISALQRIQPIPSSRNSRVVLLTRGRRRPVRHTRQRRAPSELVTAPSEHDTKQDNSHEQPRPNW